MARCVAEDHPHCVHECEGEVCTAIYEHETGMCVGGCGESLVSVGILTAIAVSGWQVKTTGQVKGIRGEQFSVMASQIRAWAEDSPRAVKGNPASEVVLLAMSIQSVSRQVMQTRFDIRWKSSTIEALLRQMAGALDDKASQRT